VDRGKRCGAEELDAAEVEYQGLARVAQRVVDELTGVGGVEFTVRGDQRRRRLHMVGGQARGAAGARFVRGRIGHGGRRHGLTPCG
jgi:hypothetical protein